MARHANKQHNYAFVDSQNVNLSIQAQGWKMDWRRFRVHLRDTYDVAVAYAFMGYVTDNQQLYDTLEAAGFVLVFKPTMELPDGTIKGNVDAELVLQAMVDLQDYDQAVIVTGDGDFYCLVHHLSEIKKLKRLLVPNSHRYSVLLKTFGAGHIDYMNTLRGKLEYRPHKPKLSEETSG